MSTEQADTADDDGRGEAPAGILAQGVAVDTYPPFAPEASRGRFRRVTVIGEEVLHRPCPPVTEFGTPELSALIDDMFHTMYVCEGVGLAANQIGVALRVFVYDCPDDHGFRHVGHIVNPVLEDLAGGETWTDDDGEGCLSVPGPAMDVVRQGRARVRGVDRDGHPLTLDGTGYFARCLQHETDHLDGRLYVDLLSRRERKDALAQMESLRDDIFTRRELRAARAATGRA